jgi:hypothetical protein
VLLSISRQSLDSSESAEDFVEALRRAMSPESREALTGDASG